MRNLIIFDSGRSGGSKLAFEEFLKNVLEDNVVVTSDYHLKIKPFFHLNLNYKNLNPNLFKSFLSLFLAIANTIYFLLHSPKKYNIIIINSATNIFGLILLNFIGYKKAFLYIHETPNSDVKFFPKLFNPILKKFFQNPKHSMIFVSEQSKDVWQTLLDCKISLYQIIPPPLKVPIKINTLQRIDHKVRIGYMGAIVKEKNLSIIIESICNMKDVSDYKFVIAGTGKDLKRIRNLCSKAKIDLEYLGYVKEIENFYDKIDFLIQPSLSESWGLTILEGLRYGKLVISTKITPLTLLLQNSKDCIFFNPKDSQELSRILEKYKSNSNLEQYVRINGHKTYSLIYNQIMNEGKREFKI